LTKLNFIKINKPERNVVTEYRLVIQNSPIEIELMNYLSVLFTTEFTSGIPNNIGLIYHSIWYNFYFGREVAIGIVAASFCKGLGLVWLQKI
jgi:hypothetical protein